MAEENYPQPATVDTPPTVQQSPVADIKSAGVDRSEFPYIDDVSRISGYEYYERLFKGDHFSAFSVKINSERYGKTYAKLRYIVANFPGLISRVVSDMLFIEPPKFKVDEGGDQEFVDALVKENHLRTVNYENALNNSALGDNLYKLRIGKRHKYDKVSTIIIEEVTPKIYFPLIDPYNEKGAPQEQELAWKVKIGDKEYLRKEIHTPGLIRNQLFELDGNKIGAATDIALLGIPGLKPAELTKIDRSLLIHIPNWRSSGHFGVSDYYDLDTLFFAMNNRMTMIDNILDKHSDPILALPPGILDEKGMVRKEKLSMFERPEDATQENDPAYITWDAKLESAFTEIEKLVDMTFLMSDTAPDIFGMGKGQSDSGRALKYKLLRTIAKAQKKQLYYTEGLAEVIYVAQLLAKAWKVEVDGIALTKEPQKPDLIWADGLPADMTEMIDNESKRIDAGLTTKTASIMRLDDVDEDTAQKEVEAIREDSKLDIPQMTVTPADFGNGNPPKKQAGNNKGKPQA